MRFWSRTRCHRTARRLAERLTMNRVPANLVWLYANQHTPSGEKWVAARCYWSRQDDENQKEIRTS